MKREEAILRVREFVFAQTGVDADPDVIRLSKGEGYGTVWRAIYYPSHFYPEVAAGRMTVDGGEYIVKLDDATGQASVFDFNPTSFE